MAELALCLFLVVLGGLLWELHRDPSPSPAALWTWGWVVLFATALFLLRRDAIPWAPSVAHLTGPLLPAFVLAGALSYADTPVPRWLLPGALVFGALRWGLASVGLPDLAHGLALVLEPPAELAAAYLVFRSARGTTSVAQRLLPPAFVAVAAVDALSAVAGLRGQELSTASVWSWVVVGPLTLGLQITAAAHRTRERGRRLALDQQRVEKELNASEGRFRLLAEHATDLICECNAEGRILYASPSFGEMLGYDTEALIGEDYFEPVHPDERVFAVGRFMRAVETEAPSDAVFRYRHRDGSWRWLEAHARGFSGATGELRVVVVARDISERRRMEAALGEARTALERRVEERTSQLAAAVANLEDEVAGRRLAESELRLSQERYRTVSELSSDMSFAFREADDGSLEVDWVTQAFQRLTGFSTEDINVRGWLLSVHPDDHEKALRHLEAARRGERREFESRVFTKTGEVRWMHNLVAGVRSEVDKRLRVVGATRDITAEKRAEEEHRRLEAHIQETQRLESLGVLAGRLAHDFNNLLSVILGNSALAARDVEANSPLQKRFSRIRSAAQHAAGLTEQMLTYSGKASVSLKPLHFGRLLAGVDDLLEASLSKQCVLEIRVDDKLPLVEGDETQLRQVLVNLVSNAADAIGERSGTVSVRCGVIAADRPMLAHSYGTPGLPAGEYVCLEVSDTGPGIDDATREHIFEPFFTTKSSGRGLGLAAVLGIVQGHGGAIALESAPGRGTTFRVLLPPAKPESGSAVQGRSAPRSARGSGTVLVVDDEEPVLELTQEFLQRAGFRVLTAATGRAAVDWIRGDAERIDAVVLDLTMPDVDGEETFRAIRRIRPGIPIVLASGYDREHGARRLASEDVSGFVAKPYDPEELVEKIRASLAG